MSKNKKVKVRVTRTGEPNLDVLARKLLQVYSTDKEYKEFERTEFREDEKKEQA